LTFHSRCTELVTLTQAPPPAHPFPNYILVKEHHSAAPGAAEGGALIGFARPPVKSKMRKPPETPKGLDSQ